MKNYIDLHMHSTHSDDGTYSPASLVEQCQAKGIRMMAVTDHNSIKGIDEAQKRASELGITCIPGIEIDCTYKNTNLHVLIYNVSNHKDFAEIEELKPLAIITNEKLPHISTKKERNRTYSLPVVATFMERPNRP